MKAYLDGMRRQNVAVGSFVAKKPIRPRVLTTNRRPALSNRAAVRWRATILPSTPSSVGWKRLWKHRPCSLGAPSRLRQPISIYSSRLTRHLSSNVSAHLKLLLLFFLLFDFCSFLLYFLHETALQWFSVYLSSSNAKNVVFFVDLSYIADR